MNTGIQDFFIPIRFILPHVWIFFSFNSKFNESINRLIKREMHMEWKNQQLQKSI